MFVAVWVLYPFPQQEQELEQEQEQEQAVRLTAVWVLYPFHRQAVRLTAGLSLALWAVCSRRSPVVYHTFSKVFYVVHVRSVALRTT